MIIDVDGHFHTTLGYIVYLEVGLMYFFLCEKFSLTFIHSDDPKDQENDPVMVGVANRHQQ